MNSPLLPEAVRPGRNYDFRADLKLNLWAFVAVALAFASRIVLPRHIEWSPGARAAVALAPLVPSLLYVRGIAGGIRSKDELQRRIQLEAGLFATTGTLFVLTAQNLLATAGVLGGTRIAHGLGWEGTFATAIAFLILGNLVANRRYR